jgi:hypothetical protein
MYPQPKVAVSWTGGVGSVCIVSGNNIQVTFLQDFGDLPLLIPGGTNLGQTSGTDPPLITAQKVVTGDKESDICSSHGTCDEDKGICQCLDDWMTSDGYGMLVLGVIAAIDPRVQHLLAQENQHVSAMGLALGHQRTDATVRAEGVGPIVLWLTAQQKSWKSSVYTGMTRVIDMAIDKSSFAILAQHHLVSYLYHRHLSYMPLMIERKSWYLDGTDEE